MFRPKLRLRLRLFTFAMPATRSSSNSPMKRKLEQPSEPLKTPKKAKPLVPVSPNLATTGTTETDSFIPANAILKFSFEEAKAHLIQADQRFEDIFNRLECKPFQELEQFHPFRALASSILGQQISWMAARSIKHRFIRLYDESIPENHADYSSSGPDAFFPTPSQVAATDLATLRTAGLSGRKAEYITDLAARFADGRLSTKKLLESTDEELSKMLLEVRGIGPWTVDMFAIFSLRRPDILPVGDLGVQRGLVRWSLAQHHPTYSFTISPEKEKITSPIKAAKKKGKKAKADNDELPVFGEASEPTEEAPKTPPASAMVPLPPTFTPSIKKTLAKASTSDETAPAPLPEGLTVAELKSRLDGKKKIKGAMLSPAHMEALTESWRPYRSIGIYYMWALADAET
ncbi:DNA glycosylase [Mycena rebaudengoi]|nr:DNA glycosylase [Mycena rebaudengoi]